MKDLDPGLIARVAEGDESAFEQLVNHCERAVLSTIYRYIGDFTAAQDVAQEVFIKVWRHAGELRHKSAFLTWLYRIVVNQCLDYKDKRKRRKTVPLDESIPQQGPGLDEKHEEKRRTQIVRQAVNDLPGTQRMALVLSKFQERSYKEVAEIMEVSLSSVESLVFRAKENLKKKLLPFRERGII